MATGFIYSPSEIVRRVDELIDLFREAREAAKASKNYSDSQLSLSDGAGTQLFNELISIQGSLGVILDKTILNLLTELNKNIRLPQAIYTAGSLGPDITAFNIDVDDGASGATISVVGSGDPDFDNANSPIIANDEITLTNAEDAVNNGTFTVASRTSTVITLSAVISGGVDNANDKTVVITTVERA